MGEDAKFASRLVIERPDGQIRVLKDGGRPYGAEIPLLHVSASNVDGELEARVDGQPVKLRSRKRSVDQIAEDLMRRFANERGIRIA